MRFRYLIVVYALTEDVAGIANSRSLHETDRLASQEHLRITTPLEDHRKPAESTHQFLQKSNETIDSHNNLTASLWVHQTLTPVSNVWGHQTWAPAYNLFAGDHTLHLTTLQADGNPRSLSKSECSLVWISGIFMIVILTFKALDMKREHHLAFFIMMWAVSSVVMGLVNKLATIVFPLPLTLVLLQMIIADVILLGFCGAPQIIEEFRSKANSAWRWSLLVLPFSGMLITSIMALQEGRAITLLIVRNLLPLISLFLERIFLPASSNQVTAEAALSLFMVAGGTIFYAYAELNGGDSSFLVLAYLLINMFSTIAHRLFERNLLTDSSMTLSFTSASLMNNLVGIIPVVIALVVRGEHHLWAEHLFSETLWTNPTAVACMIVSGIAGLSLGYSSIAVQKQVTATSMLTLQTTMKMTTIYLAVAVLGEHLTCSTTLGAGLSIVGSVWYSTVLKWGSANAILAELESGLDTIFKTFCLVYGIKSLLRTDYGSHNGSRKKLGISETQC